MSATTEETPQDTVNDYRDDYREGRYREGRRLSRSRDDKMLAGVAGGIARYLDADVTLVRLGIAALVLLSSGAAAALYVAAWLLIPADGEDQPLAATWIADYQHRHHR